MEKEAANLHGQLENFIGSGGMMEDIEYLLKAVKQFMEAPDSIEEITTSLEKINPATIESQSLEAFNQVYYLLLGEVGSEMTVTFYNEGMKAYQNGDFETAIEELKKAVAYDPTNQDAYFNLGNAYRKMGRNEEALEVYEKIIELYPGTDLANRSQSYVNELAAE